MVPGAAAILAEAQEDAPKRQTVEQACDPVGEAWGEERVMFEWKARDAGDGQKHHANRQEAIEPGIRMAESHSASIIA